MNIEDCYVGARVVYNNRRGFSVRKKGLVGTITKIDGENAIRMVFDDQERAGTPADFGTFCDCVDLLEEFETPRVSFESFFNGA